MNTKILNWLKNNFKTRKDWGVALTALIPIALVVGRAPADWIVSIVAVLFLFDRIVSRRWDWIKKPWVTAALLLWAYSVIRAAFIHDGGSGLFAAFVWLRYIVFAASLADWGVADEKGRRWLLCALTGSVLFLSVDGIIQYVSGKDIFGHEFYPGNRLTGPYKRPLLGITIANLFVPPIFWLLNRKNFLGSILVANICFCTIYFSGERMAFIFSAIIILIWFSFLVYINKKHWKYPSLAILFLAALMYFGQIFASPQEAISDRQLRSTVETAKDISASPYGLVWKSAWDVARTNPVFGVGMRQFRVACTDERFGPINNPESSHPRCYTHTHNVYLEWFSEGGIVGLLGFIGFVLVVGIGLGRRLILHKADLILWGLAAMLAVRLMPVFISTSFFNNWSAIPFWLVLGWAMSYTPSLSQQGAAPETIRKNSDASFS
ncbi:MAG: O-antigen ligase family protein [Bdellovibrionales bacterium]